MSALFGIAAFVLLMAALALWAQRVAYRRQAFIRDFELPRGLFEQLRKKRPDLELKDCQLVAHALRQFFLAHLKSGRRYVSMPSQVADDLWHEFTLFTRNYEVFCRRAFGRFLHHTPAVVVGGDEKASTGQRRTWWWACKEDHINPRSPARLALLFALDAKLGAADGFRYELDCASWLHRAKESGSALVPVVDCGADMANLMRKTNNSGGCGGGAGCGGDGSSGDSGCGGGGCGGD